MLLQRLFQNPPVLFAFEIGRRFVTGVRRDPKTLEVVAQAYCAMDVGVIEPSPGKSNVQQPAVLAQAVSQILAEIGLTKRPDTALILPDASSRMTVLDFEHFPSDEKECLQLIRFRLKKTVPFDVQNALVAYQTWKIKGRFSVLVATTPVEIINQYEQALKSVGLRPGYVVLSTVAALNLIPVSEMSLFVNFPGDSLTVVAFDMQAVRMVRSIQLTPGIEQSVVDNPESALDAMITDLYPTFVFIADNLQCPVKKLILSGFDKLIEDALARFPEEFNCEVEPLRFTTGIADAHDVGIQGFLSQN